MAKLISHNELQVRIPELKIKPIGGWSWYCDYHDVMGVSADNTECLYMAGAHLKYYEVDEELCELHFKDWNKEE